MLQISEAEINKRLLFDNPWWESGVNGVPFTELPKRSYFELFFKLAIDKSVNRAIVLMGPRRVGKTVMAYHAIAKLLSTIPPKNILYLSLETPVYTGLRLDQFVNLFIEKYDHKREEDLYIFFDEVQYLKDWEIHLKSLVDSYPQYKFIATGSAAAALKLKSLESGAGRFSDFILPPLTFSEYLFFIKRDDELITKKEIDINGAQTNHWFETNNIDELNAEFVNYLNYGGYPEAVFSETIQKDSARFIKSDIIDKVLLRDLPSLYGINDIQELNRLFTTLAYNSGNEVSLEALSQTAGVAKNTLKRYLEYLEAAFLIRRVTRIDECAKNFKRATSFKVYLTNPSMRAALFGYMAVDDNGMGALAETAIFSQWLHSPFIENLYYARWKKGEVDIVALNPTTQKPNWCIEVKWSDRVTSDHEEIRATLEFVKNNNIPERVLVTTRSQSAEFAVKGVKVKFIPTALQAYTVGKNILHFKNSDPHQ